MTKRTPNHIKEKRGTMLFVMAIVLPILIYAILQLASPFTGSKEELDDALKKLKANPKVEQVEKDSVGNNLLQK